MDISKYFYALTKFMGAISIVMGLVLTFLGSRFILIVFGILIFAISQMLMWLILYNTHIFNPEQIEETKGLILGLGTVILALGIVASYLMAKFADKFAVPLISASCGGIIAFMLVGGIKMPALVKFVVIVTVAAATLYYTNKVQRYVKSAGTALIGSFILFNGIGKYVGGYPELMNMNTGDLAEDEAMQKLQDQMGGMALFYLGGTIGFAILGTWV